MSDTVDKLNEKIHKANEKRKKSRLKEAAPLSPLTVAMELVSGVLVGVIIGLFLDKMFDSKPLFFIICILLGVIASFKNIWVKVNNKK